MHWTMRPRHLSRLVGILAASMAALVVLPATNAYAMPPRITTTFGKAIDGYTSYQPQSTCQSVVQPGVAAFRDLVLRTYAGTRNLGVLRGCNVGGRSEHKEGRAWDWGVRVTVPAEKAHADELIGWLLATDKYGNKNALARRLGIMYIIWNHRIWGAYSPGAWRTYTGPVPHTDHVHFSFSWAGARRQTSFWTGRPLPGSNTPVSTPPPPPSSVRPLPEPGPPGAGRVPVGADLDDETVLLAAKNRTVMSHGVLRAGQSYHVEVSGIWSYGHGLADAECSTVAGSPQWQRNRSVDRVQPNADHLDLYLNGVDLTSDPVTDTGGHCDAAEHRYRWDYRPARTLNAFLTIWDPSRATDNSGSLRIRIWRDRALTDETVSVPARSVGGAISRASVVAGRRYAVTMAGSYAWGGGTADGECSVANGETAWQRDRSVDPDQPNADNLDLLLGGDDPRGVPAVGAAGGCDPVNHLYRTVWTAPRTGPVPLSLWDPDHSDDTGGLRVRIQQVAPLTAPETVTVPASAPLGATTRGVLERGREYTVEVAGRYTWPGGDADAECSSATADPTWRRDRTVDGHSLDLQADGGSRHWAPSVAFATTCDAAAHAYHWTFTPDRDLQLALRVDAPPGSAGTLVATVTPGPYVAMPLPESQVELPPTASWVETVRVNADGRVVKSANYLAAGRSYLVVASGGYDTGHGEADAECATAPGVPAWGPTPDGATDPDALDLVADGKAEWTPDVPDANGCSAAHTYTMPVTGRGVRLPLTVRGLDPADDRHGSLTVRIFRV